MLKTILKMALLMALPLSLFSQTQLYTNVPAATQLHSFMYGSIYFCPPNPDFTAVVDTSIFNYADGVKLALRVDSLSSPQPNSIGTGAGPIAVGDTLVFDTMGRVYDFYFPAGGQAYFSVITVGMATTLNR